MGYFSCTRKSSVATLTSYNRAKFNNLARQHKPKTINNNSASLRLFSYQELEFATEGFSSNRLLGKGSHGSVYKAILDDGKLVAAVKRSTTSSTSEESSSICSLGNKNFNSPGENEIEILSKIRNPGLVNLLGYSLNSNERKLIVLEFMANGTLYENLHRNETVPRWGKRVQFALQIAKAIKALHSSNPPVIHRDIKSSNILIDENWNAKLGDFGLALRGNVEDVKIRSTPPAGTLGYLDPGYLTPLNLSTKSDVFSFGILLLEIISGRNAIDVNYSPPSIVDWAIPLIKQGDFDSLYDPRIEPPKDSSMGQRLATLAARCVQSRPEKRPTIGDVVTRLSTINNRLPPQIWNNFANRLKNPVLIDRNTDTDSFFNKSVEEIPLDVKHLNKNSLKNIRVSGLKMGEERMKEPISTVVGCGGCMDMTHMLIEMNVHSISRKGNPLTGGSIGIPARIQSSKSRRSRSNAISRGNRTVYGKGVLLQQAKYLPNPRGLRHAQDRQNCCKEICENS